jgi:hypothetical protein
MRGRQPEIPSVTIGLPAIMTRRSRSLFGSVLLLLPLVAFGADPCHPREPLLKNPYVDRVDQCIVSLARTLAVPANRDYAERLVAQALADTRHANRAPDRPLNYYQLAELVALLDEPKDVDAFLNFIARYPESVDEARSLAAARLYELRTPLVLKRLAEQSKQGQETVTESIAWGLANNFYPFINLVNYRRFAVGANWEVLDQDFPQRSLAQQVEDRLRETLERSAR